MVRRRSSKLVVSGSLAALALALPALSSGAVVSSTPDVALQTNGPVSAIAAAADGRVFLGGNFTRAGAPTQFGADFGQTGAAANAAFAQPSNFVFAVISDGAGGWYVGGSFTSIGGVARPGLAHLLSSGAVDPAFKPTTISGVSIGSGTVQSLALSGNTVYAGGVFGTGENATAAQFPLVAFNATTGASTGFQPAVNSPVSALAISPSGATVYAGGSFTTAGGAARGHLAAFDAATGSVTGFDPNLDGTVRALAVTGNTVYAGGDFENVNAFATARSHMAAFDGVTGAATAFDPNINDALAGTTVDALAISGTKVYAGGFFDRVGANVSRSGAAAFNATTGAVDASFDPDIQNSNGAAVTSLAVSGTTVFLGGDFTAVNIQTPASTVIRNRLAAVSASTGTASSGFDPNVDGRVDAVAIGGTRVYAGGEFNFVGAGTVRFGLAAMKADGTLDAFDPHIGGPNPANYAVDALLSSGTTLYVGGRFNQVGSASTDRGHLASFNTTTGGLLAFDPDIAGIDVDALALAAGKLYVGGDFSIVNFTGIVGGVPAGTPRNNIAAVDPVSGNADPTFDPNAGDTVRALVASATKLYAAGDFAAIGATARNGAAALDLATGAPDAGFDPHFASPGGNSRLVTSLALSGTRLFAGGNFTTAGATARNRVAAVATTTGAPDAFNPNANGSVDALALSGSLLYAGGSFTTVGTTPRKGLAAFDTTATGAPDATFNPGFSGTSALAMAGADLEAGGSGILGGAQGFAQFSAAAAGPLAFSSTPPVPALYGGSYVVSTTPGNGNAVTFSIAAASAGFCSVTGATVKFIGVGSCTINATQAASSSVKQVVAIKQAAATVTGPTLSKAFGDPLPGLQATVTGLVNGDTALATSPTCATTATATSNAGSYAVTCTGAADANYKITNKAGKLTITKVLLTVTAPSVSRQFGAPDPVFNPTYSGLAGGDVAPATAPTCKTTAIATTAPSTKPTTCSGAIDPNYTFKYVAGVLTILKAATTLQKLALSATANHPTAVLTRTDSGAAITGLTVTLKSGATTLCAVTTDATGQAQCPGTVAAGTVFTAAFATNVDYIAATA